MDGWDEIDLLGSAQRQRRVGVRCRRSPSGVRYGSRDGAACAKFSWEGFDGCPASGRGCAGLDTAGRLVGQIFIQTIQASSENATDFFTSLLDEVDGLLG
jgi:hypothetical protein